MTEKDKFDELVKLIEKAKTLGVSEFKAKGVSIKFNSPPELKHPASVPHVKIEDVFKTRSPDLTPDEILYYATPHFDTLQAEKAERLKHLKESGDHSHD